MFSLISALGYFSLPPLCLLQVSRVSHRRSFTLKEQLCQATPPLLRPPPPWPLLPRYLRDLPRVNCHLAETLQFPHLLASHKQPCEPGSLQLTSSGGPRVEGEEGGKKVKARQKGEQLMLVKKKQHRNQETKG